MEDQVITLTPGGLSAKGINKYALLQSASEEITAEYEVVLKNVEGSLTTVADNDTSSKFNVAMATLSPNEIQTSILQKIEQSFKSIQETIDPDRLQFSIVEAEDNEICIFRRSSNGISNIIINDDGVTAYSFIAYKNIPKQDTLVFFDNGDEMDCEHLALKFFSL
jgi:hypothetical protein